MIILESNVESLEQGTNILVTRVTQALHADLKHEPKTKPKVDGQGVGLVSASIKVV